MLFWRKMTAWPVASIAALAAQGLAIPVGGQDGDHAALNRVARGTQTVSVWKDARQLGKAAGDIAAMLADGKALAEIPDAVKWSGGAKGVEMNAIFLAPTPITKDNINVVIDAGHIAKDKVCEGAMAGVSRLLIQFMQQPIACAGFPAGTGLPYFMNRND